MLAGIRHDVEEWSVERPKKAYILKSSMQCSFFADLGWKNKHDNKVCSLF